MNAPELRTTIQDSIAKTLTFAHVCLWQVDRSINVNDHIHDAMIGDVDLVDLDAMARDIAAALTAAGFVHRDEYEHVGWLATKYEQFVSAREGRERPSPDWLELFVSRKSAHRD